MCGGDNFGQRGQLGKKNIVLLLAAAATNAGVGKKTGLAVGLAANAYAFIATDDKIELIHFQGNNGDFLPQQRIAAVHCRHNAGVSAIAENFCAPGRKVGQVFGADRCVGLGGIIAVIDVDIYA